jgi:phosphoesterase RecJ-like protein
MLVRLIRELRIYLNQDIATCLLNGILTDTLGFRTSSTTPEVMETAIQLMNAGASLSDLTEQIFNRRPLATIQMWSMALQDLCLEGHILWSEIRQDMRERIDYREDGDAGLVNFLNTACEADIAVVFDELQDGTINVSMRAVPGYDISQVAFGLGGGGHAQAAGCTLAGPLNVARAQVLSMLHEAWDSQAICK